MADEKKADEERKGEEKRYGRMCTDGSLIEVVSGPPISQADQEAARKRMRELFGGKCKKYANLPK